MPSPFSDLADLDKVIHEPARLAITTALSSCETADFLYLQQLTNLTKGNLSAHLSKLEKAGLVQIDKAFVEKMPRTTIRLTDTGRKVVGEYWQRMDKLRRETQKWRPT